MRNRFAVPSTVVVVLLICIILAATVANASILSRQRRRHAPAHQFPPQYFQQQLDHFNPLNTRTFPQKYYVNDLYWNKPNGPIFLQINGEGPVSGPPTTGGVVELAKKFGALIVALEHRYYGESVPVDENGKRILFTTDNYRYLHTEQALADLATFTMFIQNQVNAGKMNQWFTFGCSYSGALAAWYRLKYPHLTRGALSSSGVVDAILEFTAFDEQIATSAGPQCAKALSLATQEIEARLAQGPAQKKATKALFEAQALTDDGDFYMMLADSPSIAIQYGFHDVVCGTYMVPALESNGDLVAAFANYTKNFFYPVLNGGGPESYGREYLSNLNPEDQSGRNWQYQTCSELAYWQIAPASNSIRSKYLTLDYFRGLCNAVFGKDLWPNTNATNTIYGGKRIAATKVFYAQGSQDPWQHAGVEVSISADEPARIINCPHCGHCVDVRGCPSFPTSMNYTGCAAVDPQHTVDRTRALIESYLAVWINEDN